MRIVNRYENFPREKTITWHTDLPAPTKDLYVDESRFGQVVDHLVENAAKFTPHDGVINIATRQGDGQWILEVANSGREIDPQLSEKIFTRFYQVDETLTRNYGGSGLGLYLCREIVRLHGGEIKLDPDFAGGVRFLVSIPEESEPG
jgi:signal transduction histidine kinase